MGRSRFNTGRKIVEVATIEAPTIAEENVGNEAVDEEPEPTGMRRKVVQRLFLWLHGKEHAHSFGKLNASANFSDLRGLLEDYSNIPPRFREDGTNLQRGSLTPLHPLVALSFNDWFAGQAIGCMSKASDKE